MIDALVAGIPLILLSVALALVILGGLGLTFAEQPWKKVIGYAVLVAFALGITVVAGLGLEQTKERREALEDCGCLEAQE